MRAPERLTIDMTVVLDRLGERRGGRARELFDLHRTGKVELAFATSGRIFDVGADPRGEVEKLIEDEKVAETPQLSYPGVMFPGSNAFPGAGVDGFGEAWALIAGRWNGLARDRTSATRSTSRPISCWRATPLSRTTLGSSRCADGCAKKAAST